MQPVIIANNSFAGLVRALERYLSNHKGRKIDNPLNYMAPIGIERMLTLIVKANKTGKAIRFYYGDRQLK